MVYNILLCNVNTYSMLSLIVYNNETQLKYNILYVYIEILILLVFKK